MISCPVCGALPLQRHKMSCRPSERKAAMRRCTCGYIVGRLKTNGGHRDDCPARTQPKENP